MEMTRNQMHFIIMSAIYSEITDFSYGEGKMVRDAKEILEGLCECEYEQIDPFVKDMVLVSLQKYGEIVNAYLPNLVNWKWDRFPALTRAILLMSYTHLHYVEKVDKKVVINIAVNLAKKYIDEKQAKFINAILDRSL